MPTADTPAPRLPSADPALTPRPTREQVDGALRRAARHDLGSDMAWLAAEVRALRAELADALDVADRLQSHLDKANADVDRVAAELTASADGSAELAVDPTDVVWIRSTVEEMRYAEDYVSIPRAEWEAMTADQQDDYLADCAGELMTNQGGCGASVVDEDEVPAEWRGAR